MKRGLRGRYKILIPFVTMAILIPLALLLIPLPNGLYPPLSQVIRFRDGSIMRVYLSSDGKWRIWTSLEEIDPLLVRTTICYEDRFFRWHPGVNPFAIIRAIWQNARAGRIISGGSTLTMQLARLAEPKPRTIFAKLHEMFRAVQFELRLGKRHILELYLNHAPYGRNYEGVGAAALAYFGKPPKDLTPAEVAYLVSLPQSPTSRCSGTGDPLRAIEARNRVLARMRRYNLIDDKQYEEALRTPVPDHVRKFPFHAPHAADYLRLIHPNGVDIRSTIDPRIQHIAEEIARSHVPRLRELDAYNASIVVMENATRQVRALVGSLDYWDDVHGGQIIGFDVLRSPGSALKPFLYALALQDGIITPATALEDVPGDFSGFRPSNFNGRYRGLVPAELALAYSLNYPFVDLLRRTGYRRFLSFLESAGLANGKRHDYGLTLITGGMEVRLLDLTNLYVTLARDGRHGSPRLTEGDRLREKELLNPGAVSLTLRALSLRGRPDAPKAHNLLSSNVIVYWKTGTSWGRRDAWCIGLTHDFTVGVWVGNFSGKGAEGIVGAEAAAPITFDILAALGSKVKEIPMAYDHLVQIPVCSLSGLPPSDHCPETKKVWVVRDRIPSRRCPFHKAFLVEARTGYRACPWKRYRPGEVVWRTFTIYPPLVAAVMGLKGAPPPLPPGCGGEVTRTGLRLIHPTDGSSYLMTRGIRNTGQIPLQAYTDAGDGRIYWFANDQFIGRTKSGETYLLRAQPGELRIAAVDSAGNTARARITIHSL
ncbi:penicillin-binding protein 1C [Candidatus Poribacteria bacterium]|nr:penicillin-binding protein 1C [Candidatus Poribacteria bacterium]